MTLQVYYDLLSQPSRAVVLFLKANKIPYEDRRINLGKGEHFSEEFSKINPFQRVPVIVDGDFPLMESIGILRYLCREKDVPDHWYPKDSKAQAKVDEYLEWQHLNTRLQCSMYFQCKWLNPMLSGKPPKPDRVKAFEERMVKSLDDMENKWLKNKPYLAADHLTIADLFGACEVEQTRIAGYDPRFGRPKLSAWLDRVRQDLLPHYDVVHGPLNKLAAYKGELPSSVSKL
ncbi:glutathione S-transferase theta-1 [Anabrus simplex]|uniref:glutathione S-transferase theta-1 n=1 Tax=Anabrus simplex TaxID=316456 RepID=UPI0034DCCB8E